jgi:hypothetical protein
MWVIGDGNELFNMHQMHHVAIKRRGDGKYELQGYVPGQTYSIASGTHKECKQLMGILQKEYPGTIIRLEPPGESELPVKP